MRAYVAVTDGDWYRYLAGRGAGEVNFWLPSGGRRFGAVEPGSPFLFKSHYRDGNRIVGGGFLSGSVSLPMHAAAEWVDLGQVRDYADALVDTIGALCGPATS